MILFEDRYPLFRILLRSQSYFVGINARQPGLSCALCCCMQIVILSMFGISDEQNLKASPVHI